MGNPNNIKYLKRLGITGFLPPKDSAKPVIIIVSLIVIMIVILSYNILISINFKINSICYCTLNK